MRSLALGAILVGIVSVVAALTLLPAVLSLLGDRVNALRIPFIGREHRRGRGAGEPLLGRDRPPRHAAAGAVLSVAARAAPARGRAARVRR